MGNTLNSCSGIFFCVCFGCCYFCCCCFVLLSNLEKICGTLLRFTKTCTLHPSCPNRILDCKDAALRIQHKNLHQIITKLIKNTPFLNYCMKVKITYLVGNWSNCSTIGFKCPKWALAIGTLKLRKP